MNGSWYGIEFPRAREGKADSDYYVPCVEFLAPVVNLIVNAVLTRVRLFA